MLPVKIKLFLQVFESYCSELKMKTHLLIRRGPNSATPSNFTEIEQAANFRIRSARIFNTIALEGHHMTKNRSIPTTCRPALPPIELQIAHELFQMVMHPLNHHGLEAHSI